MDTLSDHTEIYRKRYRSTLTKLDQPIGTDRRADRYTPGGWDGSTNLRQVIERDKHHGIPGKISPYRVQIAVYLRVLMTEGSRRPSIRPTPQCSESRNARGYKKPLTEEDDMNTIKKILLALDGSEVSRQALAAARTSALAHNAKVVVFGCLNLNELSPPSDFNSTSFANTIEEAEKTLNQYLESAAKELQDDHIQATVRVSKGKPVRAIVEFAEKCNADLIVMASHGRSGIRRLLVGSVTEGVLRQTQCPLLVYPVKE
jgi:nucleotide-binding universal stress UspA family protein